jgi:hypothetical protein
MTDPIDPALIQLSRQDPGRIFLHRGYGIQWTSTCVDMPARCPISGEQDWTQRLHALMTAEYERLESESTYCHKERVWHVSKLYGRGKSTIAAALSTFRRST